jgi:hypothetical protein
LLVTNASICFLVINNIDCRNINTYDSNVVNDATWKNDSELAKEAEAFLAKPKLSRTPP